MGLWAGVKRKFAINRQGSASQGGLPKVLYYWQVYFI